METGNFGLDPDANFIGNTDAVPMNIRTEDIRRFRLNYDETYTIGGFPGQAKNGSLLLCEDVGQFYAASAPGPYSLLHLAEAAGPNDQPYREWFSNGLTFSRSDLLSYLGPKLEPDNYIDMVLQWGGVKTKQQMRFVFTGLYDDQVPTGPASLEGMEFIRLNPSTDPEPFVGIGDWYAANYIDPSVGEPNERLDMVNGRLRIRDLPEASGEAMGTYEVMVVDNAATGDERGVVKWVDPSVLTGSLDCDWTIENNGTSGSMVSHNVYTAVGTSDACPDEQDKVGIGDATPTYKLDVFHRVPVADVPGGLRVWIKGEETGWTNGILGYAEPDASSGTIEFAVGVEGDAVKTDRQGYGVIGKAIAGAQSTSSGKAIGVQGQAYGNSSGGNLAFLDGVHGIAFGTSLTQRAVGVYGKATGAPSGQNWGAYFEGDGFLGASAWTYSDAQLKTDVESLADATALEQLMQLQPRRYMYDTAQFPHLNLPAAQQLGLVAQEVEPVVPEVVRDVLRPAVADSAGNIVEPELAFKAMNYAGLIPLLLAGLQEQQAQIAQLQVQLAACCANPDGSDQRSGSAVDDEKLTPAQERLLRIAPNPFIDRTTLYCTLERAGRVQLIANSADGRSLMVLSEGQREAGEFQYEWSTENLSPGVYYITLLLDGEPAVKRAVKLGR